MDKNFCAAPFVQMLLEPQGNITPCCWNQGYKFGTVESGSFDEVWNGENAQKLREEFLSGNIKTCEQQIRHIECNKHFHRFNHLVDPKAIQKKDPIRFDLRLNGRCNLSCIMCDVWKQPNGLFDESFFWERGPKDFFPHVKEMDVLGGEPFVQKDTYRLIDEISAVNPDCTWAFVTNGHYQFNGKVKKSLEKIKLRWIQVSIDSLDEKIYSQIRLKGNLKVVLKTIEDLLAYRKERKHPMDPTSFSSFKINFSMCVQQLNWHEVIHFHRFCKDRGVSSTFQYAYGEYDSSLNNLDTTTMKKCLGFMIEASEIVGRGKLNPIIEPLRDQLRLREEREFTAQC
ncbi:MAG: radical SAM protein [Halobacteriovoraceae bacterium]|nr:radical SAM protein [Halobacteriovoraceae bacterium]